MRTDTEISPTRGNVEPVIADHLAIRNREDYIRCRSGYLACTYEYQYDGTDPNLRDFRTLAAAEFDARQRPHLRLVYSRD